MSRELPSCESCHGNADAWYYIVDAATYRDVEPIVYPSPVCSGCVSKLKSCSNAVLYPVHSIPEDAVHFHPVICDTIVCLKHGNACDLMVEPEPELEFDDEPDDLPAKPDPDFGLDDVIDEMLA